MQRITRRKAKEATGGQTPATKPSRTRKSASLAKKTSPTKKASAAESGSRTEKRSSPEIDSRPTKKKKQSKGSAESFVRAAIRHSEENPSVFHERFAGLTGDSGTPAASEINNSSPENSSTSQRSPEDSSTSQRSPENTSTTQSTPSDADMGLGFLGEDIEGELEDDNADDTIDDEPETVNQDEVRLAMNCVVAAQDHQVDFAIQEYIERLDRKVILLGPFKVPEDGETTNVRGQEMLTADNRDLFRFVNKVLQSSACLMRTSMWWSENTIRLYKYAIRDYVHFMSTHKIEDVPVTEDNFRVDGIYIVQCMKALVASRDARAGRRCPGYNKTLKTFKSSLQGLQQLLALYQCREIPNERLREEAFTKRSVVPNMHLVTTFLAERLKQCVVLQRENFDNKDRDNMFFDRYTTDQAKEMVTNVLKETAIGGKIKIYGGINAALELLLGHHLLFRGADKRKLELSDSVYTMQETSRGRIPILGFQLTQSKTLGPDGRPRCMGTCRSKDVEMCLVSAFAFSLWHRFDYAEGQLFRRPDFTSKKSWYPIKVLFSHTTLSQLNNEICYNHEKKLMDMCTKSIGFTSSKVTHLGRKSGAQNADANNINEEQILRAGMWSNNALVKYYLSPFPYDFIHFSAGFEQHEPYFIKRDLDVDQKLQDMIFPWIDEEIAKLDKRDSDENLNASNMEHREKDGVIRKFLNMLKQFRLIIIQDLAARIVLGADVDTVFTRHPITQDDDFKEFCNQMKSALELKEFFPDIPDATKVISRFSIPITKALNFLSSGMQTGFVNAAKEHLSIQNSIEQFKCMLKERDDQFIKQQEKLDDLICHLIYHGERLEKTLQAIERTDRRVQSLHVKFDRFSTGGRAQTSSIDSTITEPQEAEHQPILRVNERARDFYKPPDFNDPKFDLQLNNVTVVDTVIEWFMLTPARPSIHDRMVMHGMLWVKVNSRSSRHKRNKSVIRFLEAFLKKVDGLTLYQLAHLIDFYRGSRTLAKFITEVTENTASAKRAVIELEKIWKALSVDSQQKYYNMTYDFSVAT